VAYIEKRRQRRSDGTIGPVRWRARYRTPEGSMRARTFARKIDAERYCSGIEADLIRDEWCDPRSGRMTVAEFVESHYRRTTTNLEPTTLARDESYLRTHILPVFGAVPLVVGRLPVVPGLGQRAGDTAGAGHRGEGVADLRKGAQDRGPVTHDPVQPDGGGLPAEDRGVAGRLSDPGAGEGPGNGHGAGRSPVPGAGVGRLLPRSPHRRAGGVALERRGPGAAHSQHQPQDRRGHGPRHARRTDEDQGRPAHPDHSTQRSRRARGTP
jgi:hypothetical protein